MPEKDEVTKLLACTRQAKHRVPPRSYLVWTLSFAPRQHVGPVQYAVRCTMQLQVYKAISEFLLWANKDAAGQCFAACIEAAVQLQVSILVQVTVQVYSNCSLSRPAHGP